MKKARIGVLGTGFARLTQIPSFLAAGAEVVCVASAHLENAEKTAREFGIPSFTNEWYEVVERDDIDLISIATPPDLHYKMASAALTHNKHILCEKPMAMNADQAREMMTRAKEKGVLALINHELRFLDGRRRAYKAIRAGEIGRVTHVKNIFRNASRGTKDVKWNWWADETRGGGALGAIGSHSIDAFRWFLETEISEVFCLLKTNIKERVDYFGNARRVTSDDEANLILRFSDSELTSDASGTVSLSVVESGKYEHRVEIFGTEGSIIVEEGGELWLSKMSENDWRKIDFDLGEAAPGVKVGGWTRGFFAFAREIIAALREGKTEIPNAATFEDGLKTQIILDAARESSKIGCVVKI